MFKWFMIQKIYSKMFSTLCTKTYNYIITFEDDRMVEENTKNVISQERNLTFRWNQKIVIIKSYLKNYIFSSYYFLSEVIFNK